MNIIEKSKRKLFNAVGTVVNKLSQNESETYSAPKKEVTEGMPEILRKAAAEGAVLLKNDGVLPFKKTDVISVFGRCQLDWFYVGYGSGGDVVKPYAVNLIDGIKNYGGILNKNVLRFYTDFHEKNPVDHGFWGHWPRYYPEPATDKNLIEKSAEESTAAVVILGRAAGEDRENNLEEGSFFLTKEEKTLIETVTSCFKKTAVLLNIGNVTDFKEILDCCKNDVAFLVVWQGGMESGNAVADLLYGAATPSGKMISTVAKRYDDYPSSKNFGNKDFNNYSEDIFVGYRFFETFCKDDVLFPFGFGLSYAEFKTETLNILKNGNDIEISFSIKNTSETFSGKEVVQVYAEAAQSDFAKPSRVLCGFIKSDELKPNEEKTYSVKVPLYYVSSYDDCGKTGYKNCYVLEKGEYRIYLGTDVRSAEKVFDFNIDETEVLFKLSEVCAPKEKFERITGKHENGKYVLSYETVPHSTENLKYEILNNIPKSVDFTGDKGLKLCDVKSGKYTLDDFVAQLSPDELEALSRGDYIMNSPLGTEGNAGVMGGVLPSLRNKGIPPLTATDGPSGIRLKACCSLLPIGTLLACTWNEALCEAVYKKVGEEMKKRGSDILLAPGMNIHRNPLCGRNFEYFSEDPLLAGKTATAVVKGLQSAGVSACPKHFACNNQETNRNRNDSRVSERALREIYLKPFEICVKEAKPDFIMTSYNKINGIWSHYNYGLCTRILRDEWNFNGCVMTDWWMQKSKSPEFPKMRDNAYRVRAQVDVLMPGGNRTGRRKPDGTLLKTYEKTDGITLGELQRTAKNLLRICIKKIPDNNNEI